MAVYVNGNVHTGSGWHIVKDDGQFDCVRDRFIMADQTGIVCFVVVWCYHQKAVNATFLCRFRECNGMCGAIGACACDDLAGTANIPFCLTK